MPRHKRRHSLISFRPTEITTASAIRQASHAADEAYDKGWQEGRTWGYQQGYNEGKAVAQHESTYHGRHHE